MGQELQARVTYDGRTSDGKALLETAELLFRGDFRLRIAFKDIEGVVAGDGRLSVTWPAGRAIFELGRSAETWEANIRNPRGVMDKLGVKAGSRVAVFGITVEAFLAQLRDRTTDVSVGYAAPGADLLFYEADEVEDLARLAELRYQIDVNGAIWVVSPKGKSSRVKDVDVMAAAKSAGLVDTKVVSLSDTHTALKLVIPVTLRTAGIPT